LAAQKDPSVIVGVEEDKEEPTVEAPKNAQDFFSFQPKKLLVNCKASRNDPSPQTKLFHHMTDFSAQSMWNSKQGVEPSACLDVQIAEEQKELLAATHKNTLMGSIVCNAKGKGAKNKIAKQRVDMISGNVSSWSRRLNDAKRLKQLEEVTQLTATVAGVAAEAATAKKEQQLKAAQKPKSKKAKKQSDAEKERAKREEALPALRTTVDEFAQGKRIEWNLETSQQLRLSTFQSNRLNWPRSCVLLWAFAAHSLPM